MTTTSVIVFNGIAYTAVGRGKNTHGKVDVTVWEGQPITETVEKKNIIEVKKSTRDLKYMPTLQIVKKQQM